MYTQICRAAYCAAFASLLLIFCLLALPPAGYKWTLIETGSVPFRVGLLAPFAPQDAEKLQNGDYVRFAWQGEDFNRQMPMHIIPLMKRIACLAGQYLMVTISKVFCDGLEIGTLRAANMKGEPIAPALYNGIIPKGQAFVMGDHPHSYDSRYFGLIQIMWITEKLVFGI